MRHLIISILCITTSLFSYAMTFNEIVHHVASNNPSLAVSIAQGDAEITSMKSENNLPDPEIGFEHKWGKEGTKWGVGVSQGFEWPGVYSSRKKAIDNASLAIEWLNKANYLEKLVEIKLLLIDIINVRKQLTLVKQLDQQMDSLISKYEKGKSLGEVSILDINKLNIEKISLSRQIKSLNNQYLVLESNLLKENGGNDISPILASLNNYPDEVILSEDKYEQLLKEYDPQIKQYSLMAKTQELNAQSAKLSKLPGFSLGYKLENELGNYFNGFSIGVSIPLFSKKHKVEAIAATQKAINLQNNAFEIERMTQLKVQRSNAIALYQEMLYYKPILENHDNINLLKKALDGGQISLITYIQEVNFFLEAQQNYIDVEYRYFQALASLNRYTLLEK